MVIARAALTTSVTGFTSAKARTTLGMALVGTKAEEAKTSGQRAEHRSHDEDARHQVIDVADAASVDRAAEHVAEQQHEDHGLHEQVDDVHGPAQDLAQLTRRHHAGVGERLGESEPATLGDHGIDCAHQAASWAGSGWRVESSAGRPVSARNTSSRLGCSSWIAAIDSW